LVFSIDRPIDPVINPSPQQLDNCHAWIEVFTRLDTDGVAPSEHLEQITVPDVHFREPFNEIVGRPGQRESVEQTRRQVSDVRFQVLDRATSGQGLYLKWEITGRLRVLGVWKVRGRSELAFD